MSNDIWKIRSQNVYPSSSPSLDKLDSRQTGMSVLLVVLDECGFSHVNSQLANVGHVIADTFEVLGYENQARIARRRGRFGHHHLNQTMKNVVIEIVDH